ncbi:MAG TPA: diaminopimelate epimerase [Methylomirabilota bacterium]|jgi:diaminopimelate epimerase|nr:diaminopimelate epimerase [Methylomirabilota bacterium]
MTQFVKGHGLGNDYLVLAEAEVDFPFSPAAIRWICHRNWGVGSDGILLQTGSRVADVGLRIFNPDGSEAEKSGNGLRIFAKYLWERGGLRKSPLRIETKGGVVEALCHLEGGRVAAVTVEMGRATFRAPEIPMHGPDREVVAVPLQVGGRAFTVTCVSVGNPHCVVFTDRLDEAEVREWGPRIESHPAFPNRTNVQFARPLGRDRVEIRIWERGAGYTLASGSSSCAVAAAAVRNGLADGALTVVMPGGELGIDVRPDYSIRLRGPVAEVCVGELAPELVEALRRRAPLPFE